MTTHALSAERCGRVEPFWVALGWVQWHGTPEPQRQMTIEYRRCPRDAAAGHLCADHAAAPLRVGEESGK